LEHAHVAAAAIDDEARDRRLALLGDEAESRLAVDRVVELDRLQTSALELTAHGRADAGRAARLVELAREDDEHIAGAVGDREPT
jgi:hypothetical protein